MCLIAFIKVVHKSLNTNNNKSYQNVQLIKRMLWCCFIISSSVQTKSTEYKKNRIKHVKTNTAFVFTTGSLSFKLIEGLYNIINTH